MRSSLSIALLLLLASPVAVAAATTTVPFCDIVASPDAFDGKTVTTEALLWSDYHGLSLTGEQCPPTREHDVTTEAVVPSGWVKEPWEGKLKSYLKHHKVVRVVVTGRFEKTEGYNGPNGYRFRFTVENISSMTSAPEKAK